MIGRQRFLEKPELLQEAPFAKPQDAPGRIQGDRFFNRGRSFMSPIESGKSDCLIFRGAVFPVR